MTITTGTYKKKDTYRKQAAMHKDPGKHGPLDKNEWNPDTRDKPSISGATRARETRSGRSGSDSNASRRSRGGRDGRAQPIFLGRNA